MPRNEPLIKAGSLLCPICCIPYIIAEIDLKIENRVLQNVKILRCPNCEDERFNIEQQQAIEKQIKEK
jgi:hypothetical protein